jgi:hypothetical protein
VAARNFGLLNTCHAGARTINLFNCCNIALGSLKAMLPTYSGIYIEIRMRYVFIIHVAACKTNFAAATVK